MKIMIVEEDEILAREIGLLYNDAFEEKERCLIMRKLGFGERVLKSDS